MQHQRAFCIKPEYQHRLQNQFFDDTSLRDEWQNEVYQSAAKAATEMAAQTIVDVGCGSAFKLIKFFNNLRTVGLDLEPTIQFLRKTYPEKEWKVSDFGKPLQGRYDIVICSDVVEHIPNPDVLMQYLDAIRFRKLFISTPDRPLVYGYDQLGPPGNKAHCREWSFEEFNDYVSQWFDIKEHRITNRMQSTQMIVAVKRPAFKKLLYKFSQLSR